MNKENLIKALIRAVGKIQEDCENNEIENKDNFDDVYELIEMLKEV